MKKGTTTKTIITLAAFAIAALLCCACSTTTHTSTQGTPEPTGAIEVSPSTENEQETASDASDVPTSEPEDVAPAIETIAFDGLVGEWVGSFRVKERNDDGDLVETDEEIKIILEIKSDGRWIATYDGDTEQGPWKNITTSGRAISLLLDPPDGGEPDDYDWTFTCSDQYILHFNHWHSYDVEMTRI